MSTDFATAFVARLDELQKSDPGAMAKLRRSLTFAPGDDPKVYPYVERFVGRYADPDCHPHDARRLALYATAGLFALHPLRESGSIAFALGRLMREKDRPSLEMRFIALLEADSDSVMVHLRQAASLLSAAGIGFDPAILLADLTVALNGRASLESRDRLRLRWARDFYRVVSEEPAAGPSTASTEVSAQ